MKYEANNGGLNVTIQPSHRLSKLFRKYRDAVADYNLIGKGEEPLQNLVKELFPNNGETYRGFLQRVREGYVSEPPDSERRLNVHRTGVATYIICMLIGEYIQQKLYDATENPYRKADKLLESSLAGQNPRMKAGMISRIMAAARGIIKPNTAAQNDFSRELPMLGRINDATHDIARKLRLYADGLTIVFQEGEGENSYVYRRGDLRYSS